MLKAYKYYWENAFKYQATSTRADYWWAVLMNVIIYAILWLLLAASGVSSIGSLVNGTTQGLGMVLIIVVIMGAFGFANIFPAISIAFVVFGMLVSPVGFYLPFGSFQLF